MSELSRNLRVLDVGKECARTGKTVRQLAKEFFCSKSTVHKDLTERLPKLDSVLAQKVRVILDTNKAECCLRGGEATKHKYEKMK